MKIKPLYLLFLFSIIFAIYLFWSSFHLALFGDDWLAIWNYKASTTTPFGPLRHFFTLYGPQDILMGILSNFFGYSGAIYYALSFIFRTTAALSTYLLVNQLAKNKLAAFFSFLFFLTTFIGLEATNWVFNMNVYLGIALMNLSLYYFIISREIKPRRRLLYSVIFFSLAYIIAPSRIVLFLLILLVMDILWASSVKKISIIPKRLIPFVATYVAIKTIGNYGDSYFLGLIIENIKKGLYNIAFIKQTLITIGGLIIPEPAISSHRNLGIIGIIFFTTSIVLIFKYRKSKQRDLLALSMLLITLGLATPMAIWPTFVYTSVHRHLLPTVPGIAVLFGFIINVSKGFFKPAALIGFVLIVSIHAATSNSYFAAIEKNRSQNLETTIWEQLLPLLPNPNKFDKPMVVYFESDQISTPSTSDLVYFGFPPKAGVIFDMKIKKDLPLPTQNFGELLDILKNGKYIGGEIYYYDFPISNFYGYRIENKKAVIDITQEIRQKLTSETLR